jgi:hypothetical protein
LLRNSRKKISSTSMKIWCNKKCLDDWSMNWHLMAQKIIFKRENYIHKIQILSTNHKIFNNDILKPT